MRFKKGDIILAKDSNEILEVVCHAVLIITPVYYCYVDVSEKGFASYFIDPHYVADNYVKIGEV